jgi:hypothetical protein
MSETKIRAWFSPQEFAVQFNIKWSDQQYEEGEGGELFSGERVRKEEGALGTRSN